MCLPHKILFSGKSLNQIEELLHDYSENLFSLVILLAEITDAENTSKYFKACGANCYIKLFSGSSTDVFKYARRKLCLKMCADTVCFISFISIKCTFLNLRVTVKNYLSRSLIIEFDIQCLFFLFCEHLRWVVMKNNKTENLHKFTYNCSITASTENS
jgi:hypothetical protein